MKEMDGELLEHILKLTHKQGKTLNSLKTWILLFILFQLIVSGLPDHCFS